MKGFKPGLVVILTGAFLTCLASLSWAEFKITPGVTFREEYNDNIFLTPTDKKDDFITSISPAVTLSYTASIATLSLNYGLDFRIYAKNPDQNVINPTDTQRAKLDTTLSLYKDVFFLKVSDEYMRVPIDVRKQVALNNYFVNLTDSNQALINPYVEYPLSGTIKAKFGYKYDNAWYKDGDSYYDHDGFAGISADIASNVNASVTYDYLIHRLWGSQAFQVSDNFDQQTVSLALGYIVGPRLSFNGTVGETWFKYTNGANENIANTIANGNSANTIWSAGMKYRLTDHINLNAGYSDGYVNSVDSGTYKSETAQGTISYDGKIPFSVSIHRGIDTYKVVNRKDEDSGITINSSPPIAAKLTGNIVGSYDYYRFDPGGEKVRRYSAGLSFAYQLRIATLSFGYTFNKNSSTTGVNDYTNNIVYIQAGFSI